MYIDFCYFLVSHEDHRRSFDTTQMWTPGGPPKRRDDAMPTIALTTEAVRKVKIVNGARTDYLDANLPGLVLRANVDGSKT